MLLLLLLLLLLLFAVSELRLLRSAF